MHDNREDVRPNHLTRPQTEHLIPGAGCVTPGRCAVPGAGAGVTLESEGRATIGRAKAISNRTYEESLMSSSSIVTWPVPAPRSASCRVRWRHSLLSWAGGLSHWRRGADRLGDVRRPRLCVRPVRDGCGHREVRPGPRVVGEHMDVMAAESHRRADAAQRSLFAVSDPESHEVGLRAVARLLVDDRCHG